MLQSIARVHPVHVMNAAQRHVAADLWTKPIKKLILILPFHGEVGVESSVKLGGWLHREMIYPPRPTDGHPFEY